jgi:YHS domain-containing protein
LGTAKSVKKNSDQYQSSSSRGEDLVEDPFCHTYIPVSQAYKKEISGKAYCFCSKECCDSYILWRDKEKQQGEL